MSSISLREMIEYYLEQNDDFIRLSDIIYCAWIQGKAITLTSENITIYEPQGLVVLNLSSTQKVFIPRIIEAFEAQAKQYNLPWQDYYNTCKTVLKTTIEIKRNGEAEVANITTTKAAHETQMLISVMKDLKERQEQQIEFQRKHFEANIATQKIIQEISTQQVTQFELHKHHHKQQLDATQVVSIQQTKQLELSKRIDRHARGTLTGIEDVQNAVLEMRIVPVSGPPPEELDTANGERVATAASASSTAEAATATNHGPSVTPTPTLVSPPR